MNAVLDGIVGGWQISGLYQQTSGAPLIFTRNMIAPDSVRQIGDIGKNAESFWFDITGFKKQESFIRRTNPWYYDGLNGPGYSNLDLAVAKKFAITERVKLEVRVESYNALNGMNYITPQLDETKSDFGKRIPRLRVITGGNSSTRRESSSSRSLQARWLSRRAVKRRAATSGPIQGPTNSANTTNRG